MAELVEQRAGVVERQQRRLAVGAAVEVQHVDDNRPLGAAETALAAEGAHPGAGAFGGAGEVVAEEDADVGAGRVRHLEGAHVRVVARQVVALGEGEAEQAAGRVEGGLDHAVELQVGLDLSFVEVVLGLAHLLGVVAPVPGLDVDVLAFGTGELAEKIALAVGALGGGGPDLVEQRADGVRRLGHGVVEAEGREGSEAEQAGALGAELDGLGGDGAVVVVVAVLAAAAPGFEGGLAQVAAGGELEERLDRRARQRDDVLAREAQVVGGLCGGLADELGQAGEIGLAVEDEAVGLLLGEHVLGELGADGGEALVDGGDAFLGLGAEIGAGPDEAGVGALEDAHLLGVEAEAVAALPNPVDAAKQVLVEGDGRRVPGEARGHLALDRLQLGVRMAARQIVEDAGDAGEIAAGELQRLDGVGEGGRSGALSDGVDLGLVAGERACESRLEVAGSDRLERGHREG